MSSYNARAFGCGASAAQLWCIGDARFNHDSLRVHKRNVGDEAATERRRTHNAAASQSFSWSSAKRDDMFACVLTVDELRIDFAQLDHALGIGVGMLQRHVRGTFSQDAGIESWGY